MQEIECGLRKLAGLDIGASVASRTYGEMQGLGNERIVGCCTWHTRRPAGQIIWGRPDSRQLLPLRTRCWSFESLLAMPEKESPDRGPQISDWIPCCIPRNSAPNLLRHSCLCTTSYRGIIQFAERCSSQRAFPDRRLHPWIVENDEDSHEVLFSGFCRPKYSMASIAVGRRPESACSFQRNPNHRPESNVTQALRAISRRRCFGSACDSAAWINTASGKRFTNNSAA